MCSSDLWLSAQAPMTKASLTEMQAMLSTPLAFSLSPTAFSTSPQLPSRAEIVSLRGVTGAGHIDTTEVANRLAAIREHVKLPIGVGFGIRDGETAKAVASVSDAVVIGSRIIQELEHTPKEKAVSAVSDFLASIRAAIDEVPA